MTTSKSVTLSITEMKMFFQWKYIAKPYEILLKLGFLMSSTALRQTFRLLSILSLAYKEKRNIKKIPAFAGNAFETSMLKAFFT